jgi:hypothetical protein
MASREIGEGKRKGKKQNKLRRMDAWKREQSEAEKWRKMEG